MKQKTVMKLSMKNEKSRSKAMKIAAVAHGVTSVSIKGVDRDLLVVIGDGVDPANLITLLRNKVGHATIVSVQQLEGTRYEQEQEREMHNYNTYNNCPTQWSSSDYYSQYPQNYPMNTTYRVVYDQDPPSCSIM